MKELDTSKAYRLHPSQKDFYYFEITSSKEVLEGRINVMGTAYFDSTDQFDPNAMEKAYYEVLRRNDAFRARIVKKNGRLMQYFWEADTFPVPERIRLRDKAAFYSLLKKPDIPIMSVKDERLTRAELYICEDGSGGLILWQNHICTDGYSVSCVVYPQICSAYDSFRKGEVPPEDKRSHSFVELLEKVDSKTDKIKLKKDLKWWWRQYNSHLFSYSVPVRNVKDERVMNENTADLSVETFCPFESVVKDIHCSDNSAFMAALAILVSFETDVRRFSFNMQYHGRDSFVKKKISGPLLLTLDIMFEPENSMTVSELMKATHKNVTESIVHARFSDRVMEMFCIPMRFLRIGYRSVDWMMINNLCGYRTKDNMPLELIGIQQNEMDELFSFQLMDSELQPGSVSITMGANPHLADFSNLEAYQKKYVDIISYIANNPNGTVGECKSFLGSKYQREREIR